LFLDIDFFKEVNDRYGHAAGDSLLVEITKVCQHNIRDSDFLGRIGGDELGIVLHECDLAYATETSKKLRDAIANIVIQGDFGEIRPSVSIGATMIMDSDESAYDTLKRADLNLYRSKNAGRNQVVAA
jgi:diguanylate cyclase (GGDEF)-like protein